MAPQGAKQKNGTKETKKYPSDLLSNTSVVRALRHWLGGNCTKLNNRSPASSRLSATGRCLSRHLRMNALRRAAMSSGVAA
jgi:hypothetical protein